MHSSFSLDKALRRKAIVWGASGFLGIHLTNRLVAEGFKVTCVSRSPSVHWSGGISYLQSDLLSYDDAVANEMTGAYVFHLASMTRPSSFTDTASSELNWNVIPTLNYLEKTRQLNCRWIFTSSGGTVYGLPQSPQVDEEHPTRPISSYGVSKLAMEGYFQVYNSIHGTNFSTARIANLYGPYQNPKAGQGIIATLIDRIINDQIIEIWGDGSNVRDFIYANDVCTALISMADNGQSGRIYNVGSGTGATINEIIGMVSSYLHKKPKVVYKPARGMDIPKNILDISRISKELQWSPMISLGDGIGETCEWFLGST